MCRFIGLFVLVLQLVRSEDQNCNGIIIRGRHYEEEVLKDDLNLPFQLNVEYSTNKLFFTMHDKDDSGLSTAYINLNNKEYGIIPNISGSIATAVDNKNHIVYLSGLGDIFAYDPVTKDLKPVGATDYIIWHMFYKDHLYYTDFVSPVPYILEDGESRIVNELEIPDVDTTYIAVDKLDNIWIGSLPKEELLCYIKGEGKVVSIGKYYVNGFALDTKEDLYFSAEDGVYSIAEDRSVEQLFKKDEVFGVAFDADNNIIYSDNSRIIRLKPTDVLCTS